MCKRKNCNHKVFKAGLCKAHYLAFRKRCNAANKKYGKKNKVKLALYNKARRRKLASNPKTKNNYLAKNRASQQKWLNNLSYSQLTKHQQKRYKNLINYKQKNNQESWEIIEPFVPDYISNGVKLREEMGRFIFIDLFYKHNIFIFNELILGEKDNRARTGICADMYIPSLNLLLEFKRNACTSHELGTAKQLAGYEALFIKNFGKAPRSYSASINGYGAANSFWDLAELLKIEFFKQYKRKNISYKKYLEIESDLDKMINHFKTLAHYFK